MGKIESPAEAGAKAKEFIRKRHFKVKQILFREVHGEGNFWLMDGEVWFKWAYFFTAKRCFRLKINSKAGGVTFYEEMRRPQPKK